MLCSKEDSSSSLSLYCGHGPHVFCSRLNNAPVATGSSSYGYKRLYIPLVYLRWFTNLLHFGTCVLTYLQSARQHWHSFFMYALRLFALRVNVDSI